MRRSREQALDELARAAEALSSRYRGEVRDGRMHLSDDLAARAYLATRLPATYAAIRTCLEAVGKARPDYAPRSVLDVGAGPGSALWAAAERWPGLRAALMIESSPSIRQLGESLGRGLAIDRRSSGGRRTLPADWAKQNPAIWCCSPMSWMSSPRRRARAWSSACGS
jgi:ribosomal protein RSM22 (predicted rRNA methylase)